jgi:hypothetical protein
MQEALCGVLAGAHTTAPRLRHTGPCCGRMTHDEPGSAHAQGTDYTNCVDMLVPLPIPSLDMHLGWSCRCLHPEAGRSFGNRSGGGTRVLQPNWFDLTHNRISLHHIGLCKAHTARFSLPSFCCWASRPPLIHLILGGGADSLTQHVVHLHAEPDLD